ncbi:ATP-binding cassette domain-containing protein [Mesorhizobium sp. NBSH29]|uniref:ABC transporter ATP-binding protein n=1 Tax=Mesorhizobium sp. NBSH29 TaxID=2654249 RepID=UPI001896881D|nr:ABC transporter ATP-binding protein [Mesorhizobium sp. NBSH29]QPC86319.1 ATP-binding cassette domain-containing protein [Mesorhizobium sp. NBSH29]
MKLELQSISHSYDGVQVLKDIQLTIPSGSILSLVGPSGCGKSTLLRIVGGLLRPVKGVVLCTGAVAENCLNPVTYIFQHLALLPWRTAAGNISLALEHHPLSLRQRRDIVSDVLSRTGLGGYADKYPGQLSGGMQQRLAIARALAVRPAVLLMDEPLSALDGKNKQMLVDDLVRLWQQDAFTAVYVTHSFEDAVKLSHRVVVMSPEPGRVEHLLELEMPVSERRENPDYVALQAEKLRCLSNQCT